MLRSRAEGDDEQFYSIALQVAASAARQGHRQTAEDIRSAVDEARSAPGSHSSVVVPFSAPRVALEGLLELRQARVRLSDVVLSERISDRLGTLVLQQRCRDRLREHGKTPNRRVLFVGPSGTGKTMTAEALAGDLHIPFYIIRLESLITRYMGETAAKLRLVFNETLKRRAVYFFDEFDAIGSKRTATNDVGEMRRVLNSFLIFLEEQTAVDSLIISATNHSELLDPALTRRFDEILEFPHPSREDIRRIIKSYLRPLKYPKMKWNVIIESAVGLSQSEIARATEEAVKLAILSESPDVSTDDLAGRLRQRQEMTSAFHASNRTKEESDETI